MTGAAAGREWEESLNKYRVMKLAYIQGNPKQNINRMPNYFLDIIIQGDIIKILNSITLAALKKIHCLGGIKS